MVDMLEQKKNIYRRKCQAPSVGRVGRGMDLDQPSRAAADLAEIWAYLALEASEAIATLFMAAIKTDFDQLRTFPLSGVPRKHLAADLRVKFHGTYRIYDTPAARVLIIVRVLHGARDAVAVADRGGFAE